MIADDSPFNPHRICAASDFAQTMIVIDDEANKSETSGDKPGSTLHLPDRRTKTTVATGTEKSISPGSNGRFLDANSLINRAMELGLICSVLRPKKSEKVWKQVISAARVADIVCLDWEIYGDGGDAASKIISEIIKNDTEENGRLRLIAIYTGDTTNDKILDKIFDQIPEKIREDHGYQKGFLEIESENGVKIVCLFKTHGLKRQEPGSNNQISEEELPKRLQLEFAKLSEGLLSNVALATIGEIRRSTHHVLFKFEGQMDGPYFHHRAIIGNPQDAEEYAIDIVLSELKKAVNKHKIATQAGPKAIEARVCEIAREITKGSQNLILHYDGKGKKPGTVEIGLDLVTKMIRDGLGTVLKSQKPPGSPKDEEFKTKFSTLFFGNREAARSAMHQFAALTGIRAHPGDLLYKSGELTAKLGLGTIVQRQDKTYLMCLQASCDSVRVEKEKNFLFVPLDRKDEKPEHVVPVPLESGTYEHIGLNISEESYCVAHPINFSGCPRTRTVNAKEIESCSGFYFKDTRGDLYRWIADLKRRRALRTVQRLGQRMGRLGFDEFEPYRSNER